MNICGCIPCSEHICTRVADWLCSYRALSVRTRLCEILVRFFTVYSSMFGSLTGVAFAQYFQFALSVRDWGFFVMLISIFGCLVASHGQSTFSSRSSLWEMEIFSCSDWRPFRYSVCLRSPPFLVVLFWVKSWLFRLPLSQTFPTTTSDNPNLSRVSCSDNRQNPVQLFVLVDNRQTAL